MSTTDYALFEESVRALARTVTIGHKMVAQNINAYLTNQGYSIEEVEEDWKYYMNLAGEYHASDLDYIASVNAANGDYSDKLRIRLGGLSGPYLVDLTKELIHGANSDPAIAVEYRYGTRGYANLVQQYPYAIGLINGILYPVDKDVAIRSEDGSILQMGGYIRRFRDDDPEQFYFEKMELHTLVDLNLILEREEILILELERWIKNIFARWLVEDYVFFNEYYITTLLVAIQALMPAKIITLRLSHARSSEASSYHVREQLNDLGGLGYIVDILPEQVYMWLYRNSDYLDVTRGREDVFHELIENVLDPLGIPIVSHEISTNTFKYEYLLPTPETYRTPLNHSRDRTFVSREEIESVLTKEIPYAPDNLKEYDHDVIDINDRVLAGDSSIYPCKVAESEWVIYSPETPITFEEFLISYWIFNSARSGIGGFIFVDDPRTGEAVPMSNEAALYLAHWCFCKGFFDYEPDTIPKFMSNFIPKAGHFTLPGYDPYPTAEGLYLQYRKQIPFDTVTKLVGTVKPTYSYPSAFSFYTDTKKLFNDLNRRYLIWSTQHSPYDRAFIKRMVGDFYWGRVESTPSRYGHPYRDFLNGIGMNVMSASRDDLRLLFYKVVRSATSNLERTETQYKTLHDAAISVMKHFMNYPVQLLHSTLQGDMNVKNTPVVRTFIPDRYASYLLWNNLSRIRHNVRLYISNNGIDGPEEGKTDIWARYRMKPIRQHVKLYEGDYNGIPTATVVNRISKRRITVGNWSAVHELRRSPVTSTVFEVTP